jgi:hypothetical protein
LTANLLLRNQPCAISCQRFIGPYAISAKIFSQAYRLRLSLSMQCHKIFHSLTLKPCHSPDCLREFIVPSRIDAPHDEFICGRYFGLPHRSTAGPRTPRTPPRISHALGVYTTTRATLGTPMPSSNTWRHFTTLPIPPLLSLASSASRHTSSTTSITQRTSRSQFREGRASIWGR